MSKPVPKWARDASWAAEWETPEDGPVQVREIGGVIQERVTSKYGGWLPWKEWKGMRRRVLILSAMGEWGQRVGFRVVKGRPINRVVKGGGK